MILEGDIAVDDRGRVTFVNDFNFAGVKRFYMVENHKRDFVRAWHAHRKEAKYVFVPKGSIVLGVVEIDDWDEPKSKHVARYTLSADKPKIVYIPAGFANGFKTLTDDTQVIFFSTSNLDESRGDDIRYPYDKWDIWEVEQR